MATETIDHRALSQLVEAGAVRGAQAVGRAGGWALVIKYGATERSLAAQRSRQVRLFKRMDSLVAYLRQVGISSFEVDAANYTPEGGRAHSRPDRAEALRNAHQAAAYDKWFRQQVEVALIEADDPATQWVSNEDAKRQWDDKRNELMAGDANTSCS